MLKTFLYPPFFPTKNNGDVSTPYNILLFNKLRKNLHRVYGCYYFMSIFI